MDNKIESIKKEFQKKDYELISTTYTNKNIKLDYICNKHKDVGIQQVSYASFKKNKNNCKLCEKEYNLLNWHNWHRTKLTQEEFHQKHFDKYKRKISETVGDEYTLLDIFKKSNHCILKLRHNDCNSIYEVEQNKFFKHNFRCQNPECVSKRKRLQHLKPIEKLNQEIFDLVGDEYKIISDYKGTNENVLFYHNVCGKTFLKTPHNFIAGQRCPHCVTPTKGEQRIIDYLDTNNISYIFQYSFDDLKGINDGLLSYDIYLDKMNILIEYQGEFHDGSAYKMFPERFKKQQEHDRRKREYAKSHNIELLEIWYWDFDNIEEILDKRFYLQQTA